MGECLFGWIFWIQKIRNNDKIIDNNIDKNIILENQINYNKLTNNIKIIKNIDKTESSKNENEIQVEYGE